MEEEDGRIERGGRRMEQGAPMDASPEPEPEGVDPEAAVGADGSDDEEEIDADTKAMLERALQA